MHIDCKYICSGVHVVFEIAGAFYYTIGNISPKYRSRLSSIQLLALAKSNLITTYGIDIILKPFIDDVKKLVCNLHCNTFLKL